MVFCLDSGLAKRPLLADLMVFRDFMEFSAVVKLKDQQHVQLSSLRQHLCFFLHINKLMSEPEIIVSNLELVL